MTWELNGDIWICSVAGVPVAFAKRLRLDLWATMAIDPDGLIANALLANHTACKTIHDCEATLQTLGWDIT